MIKMQTALKQLNCKCYIGLRPWSERPARTIRNNVNRVASQPVPLTAFQLKIKTAGVLHFGAAVFIAALLKSNFPIFTDQ